MTSGVSQGSILRPLLFLADVNGIGGTLNKKLDFLQMIVYL